MIENSIELELELQVPKKLSLKALAWKNRFWEVEDPANHQLSVCRSTQNCERSNDFSISGTRDSEPFALRIDGTLKFCIDSVTYARCGRNFPKSHRVSRRGNLNYKKQTYFAVLAFISFGSVPHYARCSARMPPCSLFDRFLIQFSFNLCSSVTFLFVACLQDWMPDVMFRSASGVRDAGDAASALQI
jgi:hypothetical protein